MWGLIRITCKGFLGAYPLGGYPRADQNSLETLNISFLVWETLCMAQEEKERVAEERDVLISCLDLFSA